MSKVKLKEIASIRTGYAFRGKIERDTGAERDGHAGDPRDLP